MVSKDEAAKLWKDHQRRTRDRAKKYREEQKAAGRKQITCYLDPEPLALLLAVRKRTGKTNTDVLGEAIMTAFGDGPGTKQVANQDQTETETETVSGGVIDDGYKADILAKMKALLSDGKTHREISENLNAAGNPSFSGRTWTAKAVKATLRRYLKGGGEK